jgi:hypothetical protein
MKPSKTSAALLHCLAGDLEERSEERHREHLARVAPVIRYDCEEHSWHVPGPGTSDRPAMKSLCPFCRNERKQREAEQAMPEAVTLDWHDNPLAAKLWDRQLNERARMGELLPGSPAEREALRVVDDARADELYELRLTPSDRRRIHREHWGRKMRVHGRQTYTNHPARAGP